MPVPRQYQLASLEFSQFLSDARDAAGLTSTNAAYTMVQGVLHTFRRRLDIKEAILFASVLPAVLRALFVADWNLEEPKRSFEDRASMTKEVQALRPNHNYSPDSAIHDVATALRKHVDEEILDRVLAQLPDGAAQFWHVAPQ